MRRLLCSCCWMLILLILPTSAPAKSPSPDQAGLSGKFQACGFFLRTNNQLSTEGDNQRNDDLDGPADTYDISFGLASIYLRYQFESGTALYLGNPPEEGMGLDLLAGVSQPIEASTLDVSVSWSPTEDAWKNPYQTGSSRDETKVDAHGLKIEWQEIGGSPWKLRYQLNRIDVEDDVIGDLESDLARDGWIHELGVEYTVPLAPGIEFKPHVGYAYADKQGGSNRYHGMKAGFLVQRARPPWVLIGLVSGAYHHYAEDHPLFDEARREGEVITYAQVIRLNLFGNERLFASLGVVYVWTDSNIDFFDSRTYGGFATVGIRL